MGRIRKRLSGLVPVYGIFPLIMAVTVNTAVYGGSRMIAGEWHHYNIESPLDRLVPFWPPSVLIYLGCYLFWAVNYPSGKKGGLSVFYSGFPVKDGMPGIFSGVPHNKYPSGAGAGWTVELADGIRVFRGCGR